MIDSIHRISFLFFFPFLFPFFSFFLQCSTRYLLPKVNWSWIKLMPCCYLWVMIWLIFLYLTLQRPCCIWWPKVWSPLSRTTRLVCFLTSSLSSLFHFWHFKIWASVLVFTCGRPAPNVGDPMWRQFLPNPLYPASPNSTASSCQVSAPDLGDILWHCVQLEQETRYISLYL